MNRLSHKVLYYIAAFLSYLVVLYLFIYSINIGVSDPVQLKHLVDSSIILFITPIMFGWLAAGLRGGLILLGMVVMPIFIVSIIFGIASINIYIIIFFIWSLLLNYFFDRTNSILYLNETNVEQLQGQINTIEAKIREAKLLNGSLYKKIDRFSALKAITEFLSTTLSEEEVFSIVTQKAFDIVGKSDVALLYMVDSQLQELALVSSRYSDASLKVKSKKGDIFDMAVLKQRRPLIVDDTHKDFRFDINKLTEYRQIRSLIAVPLVAKDTIIGVLRMDSNNINNYSQDDLRLLDIMGSLAATATENALLFKRIKELAIKDGLTGIYVRRFFLQRLEEEFKRFLRTHFPLSILMLDIDNFKLYNDNFGHSAGDIVLNRIARILEDFCNRYGGIAARYGGEEFIILYINKDKNTAKMIAEEIKEKISNEPFILRRTITHINVSVGVASFPHDAHTPDELIKKSDEALLTAKREGKNRVCCI